MRAILLAMLLFVPLSLVADTVHEGNAIDPDPVVPGSQRIKSHRTIEIPKSVNVLLMGGNLCEKSSLAEIIFVYAGGQACHTYWKARGRTQMPTIQEKRLIVEVARRAILQHWQHRDISPDADLVSEMYVFYGWLREARPSLLEFECGNVEPWQAIQGWLEAYERGHPRM